MFDMFPLYLRCLLHVFSTTSCLPFIMCHVGAILCLKISDVFCFMSR